MTLWTSPSLILGQFSSLNLATLNGYTISSHEQSLIQHCDFTECDLRGMKGEVRDCRLTDCQLPESWGVVGPGIRGTCYVETRAAHQSQDSAAALRSAASQSLNRSEADRFSPVCRVTDDDEDADEVTTPRMRER